jgi:hypothetical protein
MIAEKDKGGRMDHLLNGKEDLGRPTAQGRRLTAPDQVRDEVRRNIEILAPGGGFVFNPIHNVQARTPVENVLAMFDAVREYGAYAVTA